MADFNLGAEVSMDVDPIKASSRTLERELKNINKSLRSQRSEFKRNELSAEQLANREKNLGKAIKAQEGLLKKRQDSLEDVRTEISKSNVVTEEQKRKLNNTSRAVQQAENQLSTYNRELKETEIAYKQFNRSSDQVKNSLGELKNRAKLSEIAFKQGTRSVDNYKDHLTEMNYTITKSKANINLLKQNLREVSLAHGSTSRQADKLRNDILKESIAMQIAQGRADELSDELDEVARSQRKVALAATLMGAGFSGARGSMDRIATTLRSVGELTQGVVGEVMATQFANLVPIMGSVVSAGAGIGGMLTSLAGGAIGLGGAFGIGMGAINAFAGQATYALQMLEDGTLKITAETSRYQSTLSSLRSEWEGLIAQNQAKIFNTLTNGINIARTSLSNLNPFLTRTAGQIEGMSGKMLNWVKTSSNAKTAFNILNTQGTQAFGHLLQGAYHFVDGTTAVFNKLSPLFVWASKGFENMALSFRRWANSVEGSRAISGFVEYTKTNLPIVGRIFGNVFAGLFNLFSAFSGHSHKVLLGIESVTEGFRKWSEELKRSDGFKQFVEYLETNGPKVWQLIKNITSILWGLVKGMAPVASVALSVTNAITGWMASMVNTHPMIGKILGSTVALTGAILLLLKPIFLVKGALSGMRGALLAAAGAEKLLGANGAIATLKLNIFKNATMATRVALRVMKGEMALSTVMTRKYGLATKVAAVGAKGLQLAIKGVGLALRFMTGPVGIVITVIGALTAAIIYLWKNNATFRNFVITAWNSIKAAAIATFGFLKPYIIGIWNGIKTVSIAVWNGLKMAAIATWNGIKFAVLHPIQALRAGMLAIWNGIKAMTVLQWNLIKLGVMAIIRGWLALVKAEFRILRAFFSAIWNGIKTVSIIVWTAIKSVVLTLVRSLINGIKVVMSGLRAFVSAVWNGIKAVSIRVWTAIKNGVVNAIRGMSNGVKKIVGALKSWMSKAWSAIKNTTVKLAKGLYTGVKNAFNSLSKVTHSIFNKLKNFMSNVWRSIKNTTVKLVKSLWSGVKAVWNSLSKFTRSTFNKIKNFMSAIWRSIKNTTVKLAKGLWSGVKGVWSSLSKGTRNTYNKLKGYMSKTWGSIKNNTVKAAKALWSGVKRNWNSLSSGTRKIFNSVKSYMNKTWNNIKNTTIRLAKALWSGVKRNWNALKSGTTRLFNSVKNYMSRTWNSIKNNTIKFARLLWSGVKKNWNSLKSGTSAIFNRVKNDTVSKWKSMKSSMVNISSALWSKVKNTFNTMAGGLKSIIGRIKGHITGMVTAVKKGLNKLIDGVNWVAGKLDMPKLPTIKFSTGTESTHTQNYVTNGKLNRSTLATVGDKGPGNGPGGFRHETVIPPSGKAFITPSADTTIPLAKGTRILNGAQTHAMLSSGMVPKFSIGTKIKEFGANMFDSGKNLVKKGVGKAKDIGGTVEKKAAKTVAKGIEIGTNVADTAKAVSSTVIKGIGDVFDYVSHPGKLVSKIFEKVGFNFDFLKGAELPYMLMQGAYKKLKEGVKSLFSGWLSDAGGGDGSSFTKFPITTGYYPRGGAPGYGFNSGAHFGIDYGAPYGTTINATNDGVVKGIHNFGGGLVARLLTGQFTLFFMHLSKILKEGKIKAGEPMAKTGDSGHWTTGPHVHFQVEKGRHDTITNANTVDPAKWLAGHGGGGKGGISKSASAWRPDIVRAARQMKVHPSASQINGIIAQIQLESGGNSGAVQGNIGDINNLRGTPAQGLLQYVPSTFSSYAVRGHNNIKSGYDQLLAFFNNSNWKNDIQYGRSGWGPRGHRRYAKGTNKAPKGYATVFEKGGEIMNLRGGEQIIPNDVSIAAIERVINSDIFNRTQSAVYEAISRFADGIREKQQEESIEKAELRRLQSENTDIKEQNTLLKAILGKMDALLNINNDINQSNQEIRDKNYFPSSREMTKMNNENNALNAKTRLMARR